VTLSRLSRATGVPRPTLLRKLDTLIELEYVERRGRHYYLGSGASSPPGVDKISHRIVQLILLTAKELSEMDKK
jgi:DNA-binding IclR family transcriptional regulator